MTEHRLDLPTAQPYDRNGGPATPWSAALEELRTAGTFWVTTMHPTGRPHVVPVLAVVSEDAVHVAAGPGTQKARNLAGDPRITIATHGQDLDLVVEGEAQQVQDERALTSVAEAYAATYGWSVEIRDGHLYGDGAPTAGPPPYRVFRVVPQRAFGFPATGDAAPTRWLFPAPTLDGRRSVAP